MSINATISASVKRRHGSITQCDKCGRKEPIYGPSTPLFTRKYIASCDAMELVCRNCGWACHEDTFDKTPKPPEPPYIITLCSHKRCETFWQRLFGK